MIHWSLTVPRSFAQAGKSLTQVEATALIASATQIKAVLGCK